MFETVRKLVTGIRAEVFLFVLAVSVLLIGYSSTLPEHLSALTMQVIVGAVIVLALLALLIYVRMATGRITQQAPAIPQVARASGPLSLSRELEERYIDYRFQQTIQATRAFILFAAFLYGAFHLLDLRAVSNPADLRRLLLIRLTVGVVILMLWPLSYTALFKKYESRLMTAVTLLGGFGILAMMVIDEGIHFYYEGLVLVIMFSAFVFRLPVLHVAWTCAIFIAGYCLVALRATDSSATYLLVNNQFFLVSSSLIALTANGVLHRTARQTFSQARLIEEQKERQAQLLQAFSARIEQLCADLEEATKEHPGSPPAQAVLGRLLRDTNSFRDLMALHSAQ